LNDFTGGFMRFLVLSRSQVVLNLDHITHIEYSSDFNRAYIMLTNGRGVEVMEQEYNDLVQAIKPLRI